MFFTTQAKQSIRTLTALLIFFLQNIIHTPENYSWCQVLQNAVPFSRTIGARQDAKIALEEASHCANLDFQAPCFWRVSLCPKRVCKHPSFTALENLYTLRINSQTFRLALKPRALLMPLLQQFLQRNLSI